MSERWYYALQQVVYGGTNHILPNILHFVSIGLHVILNIAVNDCSSQVITL